MIHYSLRCCEGHAFDGWFASSAAFDSQVERALLVCPTCGSTNVERALMAPAVVSTRAERPQLTADKEEAAPAASAPAATATGETPADGAPAQPTPPPSSTDVALMDERAGQLRALLKAMHTAVKENGVDVGRKFAEEARKIHYGEAEARGIYGQADLDEARELIEEGIDILPLPPLPDERN